MRIPARIPGRRLLTIVTGVYAAVWIVLEGNPARASFLAVLLILTVVLSILQQNLGGRSLSLWSWLMLCAGLGILLGLGSNVLTLFLMALKSGLHAHGPEFTPAQIEQVIRRIPVWTVGGALLGLALGLLAAGAKRQP